MALTASLGVDVGSISTKGVIRGDNGEILAEGYIWTRGDPIMAVKKLLSELRKSLPEDTVLRSAGSTGSARRLVGIMLGANVVKNEITAHAVGTLSIYPDVKTIFEIGGQDSKIILIEDGVVTDYAMNTLCSAGTGSFLSSQAKRLGISVEKIGETAMRSQNPVKIAARCTVFAESDMIHKAQAGHKKEDLIAGLCEAVVDNYMNNVGKGKQIRPPILFQGGVSKNAAVARAFERAAGYPVAVDKRSHLMGAIGAAVLSMDEQPGKPFSFDIASLRYETKSGECTMCPNRCEVIGFFKEGSLLDAWGNRCPNGITSSF